MALKKINTEQVKLEKKGDTVEGYLVSRETITFAPKKGQTDPTSAPKVVLQKKTGERVSAILGAAALSEMQFLKDGVMTKIVFQGQRATQGGNKVNVYDLFQDEEDYINIPA